MHIFELGFTLFFGSLTGMVISFWRQNILIFLITAEIMFLSTIILLIILSNCLSNVDSQINALLILTLAALETAVGLCILLRTKNFINMLSFNSFHTLSG